MRAPRIASAPAVLIGAALAAGLGACGSHANATGGGTGSPTDPAVASNLVARIRAANPSAYRFDVPHGARIVPSPQTGTFTIVSTSPRRPRALVVVLHGHGGNAFAMWRLWQPYASRHGYGLVSVVWQRGVGENGDYLTPAETYGVIRRATRAQGVPAGSILLHGFSMGSHAAFEVTALDRAGPRLFAITIAESGGARDLAAGGTSLVGSRWVIYCAGHDPWPDISGCPAMRRAASRLRSDRATVAHFLVDQPARHGGFLLNRADVERALADFERAMKARRPGPT
jgi:predicted esterase